MVDLSAFELQREQRIAANKRKIEALGILDAKSELDAAINAGQAAADAPRRVRKRREVKPEESLVEPRRSGRERPVVDYREEKGTFNARIPGEQAERRVRYIDREEIDPSLLSAMKQRSAVDSGKGVRIQGGRVYDSRFGVTCHWCRQKTVEHKVTCTRDDCGSGCRLPVSFCKMCLKNRHGEDVDEAEKSGKWVCPCCRESCGPACSSCCNCGPCRKKLSLLPTGHIIKEARGAGFDNVHDYLVHQQTGETADSIASRKHKFPWAAWMLNDTLEDQPIERDSPSHCEGPPATKQQMLTDTLPAVKAQHPQPRKDINAPARKLERKQRVLLAMGLAPTVVPAH